MQPQAVRHDLSPRTMAADLRPQLPRSRAGSTLRLLSEGMMRRWMSRVVAALATCAAVSGCRGERPPLWDLYDTPTAQMPAATGNAVIYDQTVTAYTWPNVSFWLGGPPRGYYSPYPYGGRYGRYWWYRNPAWGPPPMLWRNPAAPKAFGVRPAVPASAAGGRE